MILFSFVAILPPLVMHSFHGDWVMLAVLGFFLNVVQGLFPLFMNIVPMETVPERLAATASALSMSVGEMIGAAATPAVAGALADVYGLPIVMWIAAAGPFLAALVGFAMRESNLRKVKSRLPNGANVPAVESE